MDSIRSVLEQHLDESMAGEPSEALLSEAAQSIARVFDARNGGFGTLPKFPHPSALRFLLTRWHRTGEAWARDIVEGPFKVWLGAGSTTSSAEDSTVTVSMRGGLSPTSRR